MGRSPLSFYLQKLNERKVNIIKDLAKFRRAIGCVQYDVDLRASGIEVFNGLRYVQPPKTPSLFGRLCHRRSPSKKTKVVSVPVKFKYDPGNIRVTQREAREILNANIKCKALDSLDSAGKNPITYSLADVQNLAQKGVTVLEVATVIGQLPATTFQLLKSKKIDLVADGLWDRAQVCIRIPDFQI